MFFPMPQKNLHKSKTPIMKKAIFFTLILLTVAGQLIAQSSRHHAPAAVQQSFQKDYPEARNPQWSSTNGQWHASFTDHSQNDMGEMVAHYDQNGRHVDSHIPYDRNDVPAPVIERTHRRYRGGRDYNYTRIEHPGEQPLFQVSLNLQGRHRTMYVDDNGQERKYNDHH
jgi:hypothetical protein